MTFQDTKELAVKIIREEFLAANIPVKQIYLFGSQSRSEARPDSDWDFLVCVNDELPFSEKAKIISDIQTRLAEKFISVDIIIKSETRLKQERNNVGIITYYALKDGVLV